MLKECNETRARDRVLPPVVVKINNKRKKLEDDLVITEGGISTLAITASDFQAGQRKRIKDIATASQNELTMKAARMNVD